MIKTDKVYLRAFCREDLADVHEYCCQENVGEMAGWKHHETMRQSAVMLEYWIREGYRRAIVTLDTNKVIGHVTVNPYGSWHSRTKEIGFVLNRDYHNQGIISGLLPQVIEEQFASGIEKLMAITYCENIPSQKVLQKAGFRYIRNSTYFSPELKTEKEVYVYCLEKQADVI